MTKIYEKPISQYMDPNLYTSDGVPSRVIADMKLKKKSIYCFRTKNRLVTLKLWLSTIIKIQ